MNQQLRFKAAREFLRYSQGQIAELVGISQYTISKIESGQTKKPNYKYINFLKKNNINEDWLVNGFGNMQNENNVLEEKTLDISFVQKIEKENEVLKTENRTLRSELRELRVKFDTLNDALAKKFLGLEMGKHKTLLEDGFVASAKVVRMPTGVSGYESGNVLFGN